MQRKQLALVALIVWLFTLILLMILSLHLDLELYFIFGFIGLVIIAELTDTIYAKSRHQLYLRYIIAASMVIFGTISTWKVLEILSA